MRESQIGWIKKAVEICIHSAEMDEKQHQTEIQVLEQQYLTFTGEEQDDIHNILKEQFQMQDVVYILSYLIQNMKIEKLGVELIQDILECDVDYYIMSMLKCQLISTFGRDYEDYGLARKFLRKSVAEAQKVIRVPRAYIPLEQRNARRIVITAGQLLGLRHAPTKMILEMAYVLQEKMGYEIFILVCPCDMELPWDLWYRPYREMAEEDLKNRNFKMRYKDTGFFCAQINMYVGNYSKYEDVISWIYDWNPLFVLNMGTTNPVVELMENFTSLVSREMSSNCPVSEGEILLRTVRKSEEAEREYSRYIGKWQSQLFLKERFPVVVQRGESKCSREEENLPTDKFLIAIVGNRLDEEIDQNFVYVMKNIMEREDRADFVIIGDVEKVKHIFSEDRYADRIFYLGYRKNLPETYGMLDLYLNPKRNGGGWSASIALQMGLPVVSLPDCDVASNVGENFVVNDYDEMINMVCRYATDISFYTEKQRQAADVAQNAEKKLDNYVKDMLDGIVTILKENANDTI